MHMQPQIVLLTVDTGVLKVWSYLQDVHWRSGVEYVNKYHYDHTQYGFAPSQN